jgi:hypothetical protein
MNKISKDKRDKVVLACIMFLGLAGLLYTFVLGYQKDQLAMLHKQSLILRDRVSKADTLIRSAPIIEANLKDNQKLLDTRLESMAPQGQYYYWFLKLIDQFREEEKLNPAFIIDITPQPEFIEAGLLPNFPYRAASFGLRVNGHYQDIGRFIADLENNFPYFRVQSVRLTPQRGGAQNGGLVKEALNAPGTTETLMVELHIVTLIRGGTT